jgi:hypothetical protein
MAQWIRRLGHVALLGCLATGGIASSAPAAAVATPVEALLIGDSVMNAMAQTYGAPARALLGARHTFLLDSAGCRRLLGLSCSIGGRPRPTNAITELKANAGLYRRELVVAAGYNDTTFGSEGLDPAITTFLAEARRQGIRRVVWLTYRQAGATAARYEAHNALLRQRAAADPMLVVADWATLSAGLPIAWFSADGIHLGPQAAEAMAGLIADTLDAIDAQLGDTDCRITDTTVATAPTTTAAPTPSPARPARATAVAVRANLTCP